MCRSFWRYASKIFCTLNVLRTLLVYQNLLSHRSGYSPFCIFCSLDIHNLCNKGETAILSYWLDLVSGHLQWWGRYLSYTLFEVLALKYYLLLLFPSFSSLVLVYCHSDTLIHMPSFLINLLLFQAKILYVTGGEILKCTYFDAVSVDVLDCSFIILPYLFLICIQTPFETVRIVFVSFFFYSFHPLS